MSGNSFELHALVQDRRKTATDANEHFLAGDHVAAADARAIIPLIDAAMRRLAPQAN